MKHLVNLSLYSISAIFIILSCNNKTEEPKTVDTTLVASPIANDAIDKLVIDCSTEGLGNITILEKEAKDMINRFDTIYTKKCPPNLVLNDSFWLSKCFINAMANYIITNPNMQISGIRFIFGSEKNNDNLFSSRLFITPTQDDNSRGFRNDLWDRQIVSTSCQNELDFYYPRFNRAGTMINHYEREYRKNPVPGTGSALKDSLSRKVWFSTCSILLISEVINNTANIDGLNVKLGAYDKFDISQHPGQGYAHQSTIILVPTKGKKDDWTVVPEIKQKILTLFSRGALNHGALCPQICN